MTVRPIATCCALFAAVVLWSGAVSFSPVLAQTVAAQPVGPLRDSLAAAVAEASLRFGIPPEWILAVMRVESAGDARAVSRAGAIGLMQIMPATYAELRRDLGLGPNPFAVRDNVLAGTAYLRRMNDRYGSPGFLAAYNAGPGRWEAYLSGIRPLPAETVRYVERLAAITGSATFAEPRTAQPPLPPSPFTAPLFVARNVTERAVQPLNERGRIVALLTANTTVVRPADLPLPVGAPAATPSSRTNGQSSDRATATSSGSSLFAPRTPSRAPR